MLGNWKNRFREKRGSFKAALAAGVMVLSSLLTGNAFAQEVVIEGEACPLTVYTAAYQQEPGTEMQVGKIRVLGVLDDVYAVVIVDNPDAGQVSGGEGENVIVQSAKKAGFVALSEFEEKLPGVDTASLEHLYSWYNYIYGDEADVIYTAQECLASLGFLESEPVGRLGDMTVVALNAFLESMGLPQNGMLDAPAYLLLKEEAAGGGAPVTVTYPYIPNPADKFPEIYDDLASDAHRSSLSGFLSSGWKLTLDPFTGTGMIRGDQPAAVYTDNSTQVDQISVSVEFVLYIKRNSKDLYELVPAFLVTSQGSYRPYIKEVVINIGKSTATLPVISKEGGITGARVYENAFVSFKAAAAEVINNADAGDTLHVRVQGLNRKYDMQSEGAIQRLQMFMEVCAGVIPAK